MAKRFGGLSRRMFLAVAASLTLPLVCLGQLKTPAGPERFEKDIVAFEAADKANPPPKNAEEYTKSDPRLAFINVFPHMLADDGLPKPDIFVADRLHMNSKGYKIWKEKVGPYLR